MEKPLPDKLPVSAAFCIRLVGVHTYLPVAIRTCMIIDAHHMVCSATLPQCTYRPPPHHSVTQFSQGIQNALPLTVSVYMVQRFLEQASQHSTADTSHHATAATISRMTGLLNACQSFAMFLTAFAWGKVSDIVGRKPVVIAGNLSMMVSVVVFGASSSYAMAAVTRFAGGLVNGVIGYVWGLCFV